MNKLQKITEATNKWIETRKATGESTTYWDAVKFAEDNNFEQLSDALNCEGYTCTKDGKEVFSTFDEEFNKLVSDSHTQLDKHPYDYEDYCVMFTWNNILKVIVEQDSIYIYLDITVDDIQKQAKIWLSKLKREVNKMIMYQLTKKETVKNKTVKMYIIDSKTATSNKKEAKLFTTILDAIEFKESNLFMFAGYNPEQVEVDVNPQVQELLEKIAQMRKELEEMK